jgi:serine/threonine protein kinase
MLKDGDIIQVGKTTMQIHIKALKEHQRRIRFCRICGRDMSAEISYPDSTGTEQPTACHACRRGQAELGMHKEPGERGASERSPGRVSCMSCGSDLSDAANADGRAQELADALYMCKMCAGKERKAEAAAKFMGDYSILNVLGQGTMGIVYRAVHLSTRRICAIKKILTDARPGQYSRKLFEREIDVQSKVIHPNLVRFLDMGQSDGMPFFVTEFMAGGDVDSLVTRFSKGPMDPPLACGIGIQVLRGLQALHNRGFVHRDLKPQNFLLNRTPPGRDMVVKISDYGLAKSYEQAGNSLFDYTKTGQAAGSLAFMPPEQILDYKHVLPTADIYAVGVSLYYLLSGEYAVDIPSPLAGRAGAIAGRRARNPVEVILLDPPVPLLERMPDLPRSLAGVVDKAVSKSVEERFQSADQFRNELAKAVLESGLPMPSEGH